jgi:diguanylate cyclase (GGDEF)-like protein
MLAPVLPADEQHRLETLRSLNVLDTAPEERFDRVTRLARRLFDVPIALISLIDAERQWFKSCCGLPVRQTSREISFCGHAILGDDVFMVPDARLDERFCDNPLVLDDPNIRFYAGMPLRVPNGSKLGTLCIIDRQPRTLSADDLALLRDLARMAAQELAAVQLATMDEMTLLSNRRGFEALARHALAVGQRQHKPLSLLYFDLDGFKQINDRFGHAEGDRALVAFADLLKGAFRDSDVVARLGGDEFVALLTDDGPLGSAQAIERLAQAVAGYNAGSKCGYSLAFSVGIVHADLSQPTALPDLLRQADQLMYERKRLRKAGRAG